MATLWESALISVIIAEVENCEQNGTRKRRTVDRRSTVAVHVHGRSTDGRPLVPTGNPRAKILQSEDARTTVGRPVALQCVGGQPPGRPPHWPGLGLGRGFGLFVVLRS